MLDYHFHRGSDCQVKECPLRTDRAGTSPASSLAFLPVGNSKSPAKRDGGRSLSLAPNCEYFFLPGRQR
jgi:hypothetical protein